ncbi:radical SAM/SPASM peptide maturase DarW [Myxococcus faecalis]|uniref:radical SAM/SPASM peptide maturase DarW n=1 Tax=Myxococcus faecalis TaxID=3115646 RepID=UPI0024C9301A|nr:radical SAM protein [Myxococcus sp. MH1]
MSHPVSPCVAPGTEQAASEADLFAIPEGSREAFLRFRDSLSREDREALRLLAVAMKKKSAVEFIGSLPKERCLDAEELCLFDSETVRKTPTFRSPVKSLVVVLKATRLCNLRCTYCRSWAEGPDQTMAFSVLLRAVRDILSMTGLERVEFVWHGGEVTLLRPSYFKKLIWLQQQFRQPGQTVRNSMQTNATHLSEEWLEFLSALDMGVGVSLDGPPEVHDSRRLNQGGGPTSKAVIAGLERLRKARIPHGALMVVDRDLRDLGAARLLEYLDEIELRDVNFLNVLPDNVDAGDGQPRGTYLSYPEYVAFLVEVFDLWWARYRGTLRIKDFESLMPSVRSGAKPPVCYWEGDCMGRYVTLEANGDLAPCDKYVGAPGSVIGNVMKSPVSRLLATSRYLEGERTETRKVTQGMESCGWFGLCQGGCPHDVKLNVRYVPSFDGTCCGLSPLLERMRAVAEPSSPHLQTPNGAVAGP